MKLRVDPITPPRWIKAVGHVPLGKPLRSTGMDARTIARAHLCILECIHVEVATSVRSPQPVER